MNKPYKNTYTEYKKQMKEIQNKLKKSENNPEEYIKINNQLLELEKDFKKDYDLVNRTLEEKGINFKNMVASQEKCNKYEEDYNEFKNDFESEGLRLANQRALQDKRKITNIYDKGVNIEGGTVIDSIGNNFKKEGKKMNTLFLNKGEKLTDRIETNEATQMLNKEGALGEVIKGMVTGEWNNKELKNIVTTTATGVLIPEVLSARVIDLARDMSLFTNSGVPTVPMQSDNMTISRIKKDPILGFKAEGEAGKNGSFELDSVKLESKTVYGYAYITLEAIKSSQNLDSIVRQVFAQAMANTIDKAFLYGETDSQGNPVDYAPSGIMNDTEVNSVIATNAGYDDFIKAIGKIRKSNGNPTVYGINADTEEIQGLLKDSYGIYLEKPKSIQSLTEIVSNQLNSDEAAGNDAIVFDPNALLIGIQNNIQIKIIEDSECLKKGLIGFQIYSMLDCKSVQPKHICKITGIKEQTPISMQ